MRLNKALPYELVGGCPGVAYQQNGLYFSPGGQQVEIVQVKDDDGGHAVARAVEDATDDLMPPAENMPVDTQAPQDPKTLHWRQLKVLVETYGGTWTNRENALAFLSGRSPAEASDAA